MSSDKRVLILLNDLMFRVKIDEVVRRAGLTGEYYADADSLRKRSEPRPQAVVIDLNHEAGRPLELIAELKSGAQTAEIPLLAYVSHVQVELKSKAEALGCDWVVARSALPQSLLQFLRELPPPE